MKKIKVFQNKNSNMIWVEGITHELATGNSWRQDGRELKSVKTIEISDVEFKNNYLFQIFHKYYKNE